MQKILSVSVGTDRRTMEIPLNSLQKKEFSQRRVNMEVLLYFGFAYIGFLIVYFVIKAAVKHAIRESSDYIQKIITNAIKESKTGNESDN